MSRGVYARVERTIIILMLLGMVGMFQPFVIGLYRYGFLLVLFSTILFIIISHISPRSDSPEASAPMSLEQAAESIRGHER
jgi:hypothetical protein